MKKPNRKVIIITSAVIICLLVAVGALALVRHNLNKTKCVDIIGDGYAMGTDPQPVVIGNSCDQ